MEKVEVEIVTKCKDFIGFLEVEVGTTGTRGGDTGHGGRTYLRFKKSGGSDIRFQLEPEGDEVALLLGGDIELKCLIDGLQFALEVLKESQDGGTSGHLPSIGQREL
jgi:hypothetical protein